MFTFPASCTRSAAARSGTAAFGRLGVVCAWGFCVVTLGCRLAVAQTDSGFGHAAAFRASPESIQPVRLLGIEKIDAKSTHYAYQEAHGCHCWLDQQCVRRNTRKDTVGQANRGTRLLLSAEDSLPPGLIAPERFDEFYADSPGQPLSFRDDLHRSLPVLRDDAFGLVNWNNAAILGTALGAAIGIRQDLDGQVREYTARHPERWGDLSLALGRIGEVQYQAPVLLGLYAYSLRQQDEELHQLSGSLLSAYTISGLSTITIKAIANTDRPSQDWNDGQFGFPSFHTSSSFSIAAVLDEYYGPKAGLPAYALAGLIGWSRLDERDHDLSDVVFGAALGFVIGKSVARGHLYGDSRVRLLPYVHPTDGTSGLMLDIPY